MLIMNKYESQNKIELLVNDFKVNYNSIKNYNEEETKRKLIEPFFESLGWDFQSKGKNSQVHYEHLAHKTKSKRVDYIIGKNKGDFLIEAKAVHVKLDGHNKNPIIQANNYAWNKSLFCVLTDFEEFQLIKPIKPNLNKPDICIVPDFKELGFEQYVSHFDLFYDTFSYGAVNNGSLDNLLSTEKKKRKFYTIDDDFLNDLETWRVILANNIIKNNADLVGIDNEFLSQLTQRVLDRIIFTRILEDREIEPAFIYKVITKENIYNNLNNHFQKLQPKYNGLIYNKHSIDTIKIDDKPLKEILINICDTEKKEVAYQFDQIPIEILGSIYERFLGKTLHINLKNKRDLVTLEKTYLTKDTGIYYTPDYVVNYICKNTIVKLFKNKTPSQIKDIKILDIACGSGGFLVGAYSYLLEWYEDYYNSNPDKAKKHTIEIKEKVKELDGTISILTHYKLSRDIKRKILVNHIYGIDIDNQAIEVTQMSLFLKMLENDYDIQLEFEIKQNILPNLEDNIICGNSLLDKCSKEDKHKLKPLEWENYFPDIIKWNTTFEGQRVLEKGYGFNIIIGNPPYVKEYTNRQLFDNLKDSYIYRYYQGKMDYWYLFTCQSIDLLKDKGLHSYITPSNWNTNNGASKLRKKILNETKIISLVDFLDYKVFENAGIQTMIYILEKKKPTNKYELDYTKVLESKLSDSQIRDIVLNPLIPSDINQHYKSIIDFDNIENTFTFNDSSIEKICIQIKNKYNFELQEKEIIQGIVGAPDKCFLINDLEPFNNKDKSYLKPFYTNSNRYYSGKYKYHIFYLSEKNFKQSINDYPNIKNHFTPFKELLRKSKVKYKTPNKKYYYLHRERQENFFKLDSKIICYTKTKYPKFYLTKESYYCSRALNVIKSSNIDMKYLTCLLNSNISYFWLYFKGKKQGDQLQIDKAPLMTIPIIKPTKEPIEIINLYDKMVTSIKEYQNAKGDYDKKSSRVNIKTIDKHINQHFYKVYGLNTEDIKIIEDSLPKYDFL